MNEYVAQPMNVWFMWFFGIGAISFGILLLIFAQFTMRRIEKQIKKDNISTYKPLDFGGSRVVTYAYVILLPEPMALRLTRLIDVDVIRHYANRTDWWLSLFFVTTSHLWLGIVFLGTLFGADT